MMVWVNYSVRLWVLKIPVVCEQIELPILLIVALVLRTTMFVTGVFVNGSQMLCSSFYLLWVMMSQDDYIYVMDGMSQEPRCYIAVYLSLSADEFILYFMV